MEATGLRTTAYNEALAYTRGVKPEDLSTDYSKVIPIGRDGKLDEVGSLVAYLVSDQASYITGTTVNISGGNQEDNLLDIICIRAFFKQAQGKYLLVAVFTVDFPETYLWKGKREGGSL